MHCVFKQAMFISACIFHFSKFLLVVPSYTHHTVSSGGRVLLLALTGSGGPRHLHSTDVSSDRDAGKSFLCISILLTAMAGNVVKDAHKPQLVALVLTRVKTHRA